MIVFRCRVCALFMTACGFQQESRKLKIFMKIFTAHENFHEIYLTTRAIIYVFF
jgi:hypothetical protein